MEKLQITMKSSLWKVMIVFLFGIVPFFANAQTRLIDDIFNYTQGDLVGQGDWVQNGTSSFLPLQVVDVQLTYPGYQNNAVGKSVKLDNSGQDVLKGFTQRTSGDIYAAMLVNFTAAQSANNQGDYFFHFGESTAFSLSGGRVMVKKSPGGDKMQFGITRSGTSSITIWDTNEYELNKTHLVILKYKIVAGEKNDIAYLFVNPVISATEPEPNVTSASSETGIEPAYISAIGIRQGTGNRTPLGDVGVLRVDLSWEDLFDTALPEIPSITLTPSSISFGGVLTGETYTRTINVKGENLEGDITVSFGTTPTGELTLSATTIPKADAESENGFDLTITLTPLDDENYKENIFFDSPNLIQKKISPMWSTSILTNVDNLAALRGQYTEDGYNYRVTGEVLVSHVYKDGSKKYIYIQDATAGITIDDSFGDITKEYKAGDKLTNITGKLNNTLGTFFFIPLSDYEVPVSEGNDIIPMVVTLADLKANPANYEAKLIKVENAEFFNRANENGGIFTQGTNNKIKQGEAEASMRVFKAADFLGDVIPAKADIIGIPTSGAGTLVAPRSRADISSVTPSITLTPSSITFGGVFTGETYTRTINVKGENLEGDITVSFGATPTGELTLSATTIPKADAESENGFDLTVTLTPVNDENYTDDILFDSPNMEQKSINAYWSTTSIIIVNNLKELREAYDEIDQSKVFKVTGEVIISYLYTKDSKTYFYIQDNEGGMFVNDSFNELTTTYKAGSKIKDIIGNINKISGVLNYIPSLDFGNIISEDNTLQPVMTTLEELAANPANYESRLIKVEDVEFPDRANENDGKFAEGTDNKILQNTTEAKMHVFGGVDHIGITIPGKANLTGIVISGYGDKIAPRNKSEIESITVNLKENILSDIRVRTENSSVIVSGKNIDLIEIYSLTGVKLQQIMVENEITVIHLNAGVYLVKVAANNIAETQKVIIK